MQRSAVRDLSFTVGESIEVDGGLESPLACQRVGAHLMPDVLNTSGKLEGGDSYRAKPPKVVRDPASQPSTSTNRTPGCLIQRGSRDAGCASRPLISP